MGIPLAALAIRPPEQPPDQLGNVARAIQLKQLMQAAPLQQQQLQQQVEAGRQQNVMGQMQIEDTRARNTAFQQWDGKSFDDIPKLMKKNGASVDSVMALQKQLTDSKEKLLKLDTDTFKLQQDKNNALLGKLNAATEGDDAGLPARLMQTAQGAVQEGLLDPQHAQQVAQLVQQNQDPAQLKKALSVYQKSLMGQKEQFDQAEKERTTSASEWKEFANLGIMVNSRTGEIKSPGGGNVPMTPGMMESKYVGIQQKKNQGQALSEEDAAFAKGYEKLKTLMPQFTNLMAITGGGLGPTATGSTPTSPQGGAGVVTPKPAPANAPGGWATPEGKTLNNVPAAIRGEVQQVLEYRRADPSITQRGPVGQAINSWVASLDPQHDATTFPAKNKILNEYVKDAGNGEIGAINTALGHLGDLYQASQALNKNDIPLLHSIASKIGVATGGTAETVYQGILHRVGPEMTKAYLKSGGTEGERGSNEADFDINKGQKQIQNNIFESANLLNSKLASKRSNWENTFQPYRDQDHFDNRFLTPEAKSILQNLGSRSPVGKSSGGAGSSVIYARDPSGKLHSAPAGTALPAGWKQEQAP